MNGARHRWATSFALLFSSVLFTTRISAQAATRRAIVIVTDSLSRPLAQTTVEASFGDDRVVRVTDDDGRATVLLPWSGRVTLSIRRIGYTPAEAVVAPTDSSGTFRIVLRGAGTPTLERVRVTGTRSLSGYIVAAATQRPLHGAIVSMPGTSGEAITDSTGAFFLRLRRTRTLSLLARAKGYTSQFRVERLNAADSRELLIALVSDSGQSNSDRIEQFDFERRVAWRGASSALIGSTELRATGANGLLDAILSSTRAGEKGLRPTNAMCVFVDGQPQPGQTVESFPTELVRLIELYDATAERLGQLKERWPRNAPCGSSEISRSSRAAGAVRWIVIWTNADLQQSARLGRE